MKLLEILEEIKINQPHIRKVSWDMFLKAFRQTELEAVEELTRYPEDKTEEEIQEVIENARQRLEQIQSIDDIYQYADEFGYGPETVTYRIAEVFIDKPKFS